MNDLKNQTNLEIKEVLNQPYKYGFQTEIEKEEFPKGINEDIIHEISNKKDEPEFLRNFRLKGYQKWKEMKFPNWANLDINSINFDQITYYSIPKEKNN